MGSSGYVEFLASSMFAHQGCDTGTGKTTVVIEILVSMLRDRAGRPTSGGGEDDDEEKLKLLVTASTHNGRL
jgi:hypothetical protein